MISSTPWGDTAVLASRCSRVQPQWPRAIKSSAMEAKSVGPENAMKPRSWTSFMSWTRTLSMAERRPNRSWVRLWTSFCFLPRFSFAIFKKVNWPSFVKFDCLPSWSRLCVPWLLKKKRKLHAGAVQGFRRNQQTRHLPRDRRARETPWALLDSSISEDWVPSHDPYHRPKPRTHWPTPCRKCA